MVTQHNTHRNWDRTLSFDLDIVSDQTLRKIIKSERDYYNTLVTELNSKLRVLNNEIVSVAGSYEKLWGDLAYCGVKLKSFANLPIDKWPPQMVQYHGLIINNSRLAFSDKQLMIYDITASNNSVNPIMRKEIALSVIRWVQPQAKQMGLVLSDNNVKSNLPIQMPQPYSVNQKQHLQLTGSLVDISYDESANQSTVIIPYINKPIVFNGQNLKKAPRDLIVIRQPIGTDNKWRISFKESNAKYQLDIIDTVYQSKRKRNTITR